MSESGKRQDESRHTDETVEAEVRRACDLRVIVKLDK